MSQVVVQGEVELIRRYHGAIAEVAVLALGFLAGLAVLGGATALVVGF